MVKIVKVKMVKMVWLVEYILNIYNYFLTTSIILTNPTILTSNFSGWAGWVKIQKD